MKILVTGADGFIGSHLVEKLLQRGHHVRAFVLYNSFNSWGWLDHLARQTPQNLEVFAGDIRDPHGVRAAMSGCETVLHLAALIAIPYSYHSPDTYVATNIQGTLNVLQAARDLGVARVVHTSTSEVYGTAQVVPIPESHPLNAQSPYAASKVGADQLAISFYASFGTPVVVARPFNTYGPRQSARAVIPNIISQLASDIPVKLGALYPTRDFSYVEDTVDAFITVALSNSGVGEVFNFGTGYEISIHDTAQLIAEVMGVPLSLEHDQQRSRPASSEVERLCADVSKFTSTFGWTPRFSGRDGLVRGLKATADWFRDDKNLERYKVDRYNI